MDTSFHFPEDLINLIYSLCGPVIIVRCGLASRLSPWAKVANSEQRWKRLQDEAQLSGVDFAELASYKKLICDAYTSMIHLKQARWFWFFFPTDDMFVGAPT
jgi:hypothetical protein